MEEVVQQKEENVPSFLFLPPLLPPSSNEMCLSTYVKFVGKISLAAYGTDH